MVTNPSNWLPSSKAIFHSEASSVFAVLFCFVLLFTFNGCVIFYLKIFLAFLTCRRDPHPGGQGHGLEGPLNQRKRHRCTTYCTVPARGLGELVLQEPGTGLTL